MSRKENEIKLRRRQRRRYILLAAIIAGIVEAVCTFIALFWEATKKQRLATIGILSWRRIANALVFFRIAILLVVLVIIALIIIFGRRKDRRLSMPQRSGMTDTDVDVRLREEDYDVVDRLNEIKNLAPRDHFIQSEADEVVGQLLRISSRQATFEDVLDRSGVASLEQLRDVLKDANAAVRRNASSIADRMGMYIHYGDPTSANDRELISRYHEKIKAMASRNNKLIAESDALIDQAMTYLENRETENADSLLDVVASVREAIEEINLTHLDV